MPYFTTSHGAKLYYEILNPEKKESILLFNGIMMTTSSWKQVANLFAKMGFRVIMHDFKGQMLSDKPDDHYSMEGHSEDAIELCEYLGIETAHFIGASYGGEVAIRTVIDNPSYAKSLCIISAASEMNDLLEIFVRQWRDLALSGDAQRFIWGVTPTLYSNSYIRSNRNAIAARAAMIADRGNNYLEGQVKLYDCFLEHKNMTRELKNIKCPTLIICGEEDLIKPIKFSKIIAKNIKNSEYVVIPGCGHAISIEKPETLYTLLAGFIAKQQLADSL
ncbi:MAG: alpha/beta hydrolase [Spirochaetaceae bacterium]|nr:MAG: alpha/beta hydrolase [Spirochaetaceae bacterium]